MKGTYKLVGVVGFEPTRTFSGRLLPYQSSVLTRLDDTPIKLERRTGLEPAIQQLRHGTWVKTRVLDHFVLRRIKCNIQFFKDQIGGRTWNRTKDLILIRDAL